MPDQIIFLRRLSLATVFYPFQLQHAVLYQTPFTLERKIPDSSQNRNVLASDSYIRLHIQRRIRWKIISVPKTLNPGKMQKLCIRKHFNPRQFYACVNGSKRKFELIRNFFSPTKIRVCGLPQNQHGERYCFVVFGLLFNSITRKYCKFCNGHGYIFKKAKVIAECYFNFCKTGTKTKKVAKPKTSTILGKTRENIFLVGQYAKRCLSRQRLER